MNFGRLFWLSAGSVVYTYLGYPLVLTLAARLKPAPPPWAAHEPAVTLLIAAYNEEAVIAGKLENSLQLDYPADCLQILVATDGSDDRTVEIVRTFADRGVELSHSPQRRGKMAAINRALGQARGDIVIFSDANNAYAADALRQLVAPFSDPTVGAVSGAKTILSGDGSLGEAEGLYWKYESFIKKQETRLGTCTGVAGEILAVRRQLLATPPPDHIINDDFFVAMQVIKAGARVVYVPEARSYERVSLSEQDEITRRSRIVAGRYQALLLASELLPFDRPVVVWQVVSHKFLRPLVPLAFVGALLANLAAVLFGRQAGRSSWRRLEGAPAGWMLAAQGLFYGLALFGPRMKLPGLPGKLVYLPVFLVNSNVAAVLGLVRFLNGKQTNLWQRAARREE